jgi:hypothetical protein
MGAFTPFQTQDMMLDFAIHLQVMVTQAQGLASWVFTPPLSWKNPQMKEVVVNTTIIGTCVFMCLLYSAIVTIHVSCLLPPFSPDSPHAKYVSYYCLICVIYVVYPQVTPSQDPTPA